MSIKWVFRPASSDELWEIAFSHWRKGDSSHLEKLIENTPPPEQYRQELANIVSGRSKPKSGRDNSLRDLIVFTEYWQSYAEAKQIPHLDGEGADSIACEKVRETLLSLRIYPIQDRQIKNILKRFKSA